MQSNALLYEKLLGGRVRCLLCSHRCLINNNSFGLCGVRENKEGSLYTHAYGEVVAANADPIEKKPLFHFLPGSVSFSIATYGCNFRCGFCQNWQISQADYRKAGRHQGHKLTPQDAVSEAKLNRAASIAFTYTEPTIFFEYAFEIAKLSRGQGILSAFVTNGYMTKEMLNLSKGYLDAANVDLKSFSDEFYRKACKARLRPVCDSIIHMKKLGIWVEVTTLVIPGLNDSKGELKKVAEFIVSVGEEIPWHISRFHPDYNMRDTSPTPVEALEKAYDIGKEAGLKYVYTGNVSNAKEDTFCSDCGGLLIKRRGFSVISNNLDSGACPSCNKKLEGIFYSTSHKQ